MCKQARDELCQRDGNREGGARRGDLLLRTWRRTFLLQGRWRTPWGAIHLMKKSDDTLDFILFLIRKECFGLCESVGSWLNLSWFKNTITWGRKIKMPSISSQLPHINITWYILFLINKFIFGFICLFPAAFSSLCSEYQEAVAPLVVVFVVWMHQACIFP